MDEVAGFDRAAADTMAEIILDFGDHRDLAAAMIYEMGLAIEEGRWEQWFYSTQAPSLHSLVMNVGWELQG